MQPPHGSRGFSLHGRARAGWPGAREVRLASELAGGWHVIVKSEKRAGKANRSMAPYRLAT